jgi:hypothetical protein
VLYCPYLGAHPAPGSSLGLARAARLTLFLTSKLYHRSRTTANCSTGLFRRKKSGASHPAATHRPALARVHRASGVGTIVANPIDTPSQTVGMIAPRGSASVSSMLRLLSASQDQWKIDDLERSRRPILVSAQIRNPHSWFAIYIPHDISLKSLVDSS